MPRKDPDAQRIYTAEYRISHHAEILARKKRYRETHREELRLKAQKYYIENHDARLQADTLRREQNREEIRRRGREKSAKYREEHRVEYNIKFAKYRIEHHEAIRLRNATYDYREKRRQYREANREAIRERDKKYHEEHPEQSHFHSLLRRARKSQAPGNGVTIKQWRFVKTLYKDCCVYCGKKSKRLTMDHVVALACGGAHDITNIVPACRSCNSKKHVGPPPIPTQFVLPLAM